MCNKIIFLVAALILHHPLWIRPDNLWFQRDLYLCPPEHPDYLQQVGGPAHPLLLLNDRSDELVDLFLREILIGFSLLQKEKKAKGDLRLSEGEGK